MVRASIRRILSSPAVEVSIRAAVVLGLIAAGLALSRTQDLGEENQRLGEQNRELTQCVAAYNNANNARGVALTQAADEERTAERKADDAQAALFLSPVLSKPTGERTPAERAEILRLFRAYQIALSDQRKERADADGARRDHPIPDPPSQVCG